MSTLKNVVKTLFISDLISVLAWGSLTPYTTILKGLLTVPIISSLFIISAITIEFLPRLSKMTTLRSIWLIRRVYDLISILLMGIAYHTCTEKEFVFLYMVILIPFSLLLGAEDNKAKSTMVKLYSHRTIEAIGIFQRVWMTRVGIIVTAFAGATTAIQMPTVYLFYIWVIFSLVDFTYGLYMYKKYVRGNKLCN